MASSFVPQNYRVALLAGGRSGEREISLASGEGARQALDEAGFATTVLDPANGEHLKELIDGNFDVAFLCLHGKYGEDGTVQGFLELIGLPYTGSGVWSSAVAMDKVKSKVFYEAMGIPTPPSCVVRQGLPCDVDRIIDEVGSHCVVKPIAEGSALGVYIVDGARDLSEALAKVLSDYDQALVESYVEGTELTVAVMGNDDPTALPVIEIVPQNDFYDFESKYALGGSQHICPARLSAERTALVQEMAVRAHRALECKGASRSDFILDKSGDVWILETNTIPGMTETSLLPDAARAAGIPFAELCTQLIRLALE